MMSRRNVFTALLVFWASLVLTQFQNCAPAGNSASASAGTSAGGGNISIVDDLNKAELQFAQQSIQIHDEVSDASLTGLCSRLHNGAGLRWSIRSGGDASGEALVSGTATCSRGQFGVRVEGLEDMVCGVDHLLVVEGDWGGSTFTHVSKRCQPLASEASAAPEGSPFGTECELEYQPAGGDPCTLVCYREQKVVLSKAVEAAQCSGLAARLAGP
jgi:hypothetical protein